MGKPGRQASDGPVRNWDVQNLVAITEVLANGDGTYDVVGFARPYQPVSVQTFDAEGNNASVAVNAQPDVPPNGWKAMVTPVPAPPPICFAAQGLSGATSTVTYPPAGMFFFGRHLKKRATKKPVKKK